MLDKSIYKNAILLLSYNQDPHQLPRHVENDFLINPLPCTFNPTGREEDKCPGNVCKEELWLVLQYFNAGYLRQCVVFLGKKSSGSIQIPLLIKELFEGHEHVFTFVCCQCDLKEKHTILDACGFKNVVDFADPKKHLDPKHRCEEWGELWRAAIDFARKN
jgi:hypothetical protein